MEAFDISDYLKSIVGVENYRLDQAKLRFEYARSKNKDQVTVVWALVLAVLHLEIGQLDIAIKYLDEGADVLVTAPDEGLNSLVQILREKTIELRQGSGLSH